MTKSGHNTWHLLFIFHTIYSCLFIYNISVLEFQIQKFFSGNTWQNYFFSFKKKFVLRSLNFFFTKTCKFTIVVTLFGRHIVPTFLRSNGVNDEVDEYDDDHTKYLNFTWPRIVALCSLPPRNHLSFDSTISISEVTWRDAIQ